MPSASSKTGDQSLPEPSAKTRATGGPVAPGSAPAKNTGKAARTPASKPRTAAGTSTGSKPVAQPLAKANAKSGARPAPKSDPKSDPEPASRSGNEPAAQPAEPSVAGHPEYRTPPTDRQMMIRVLAYELYMRRGGAPGDEVDDWLAAEKRVDELLAGTTGVPT